MTFTKRVEDFTCDHCGAVVVGSGYTNHCPACLWSKHVDVDPGDRAAVCKGLMKPITIEQERGEWILTHRCERCGHTKRNKASPDDNSDVMVELARIRT